MAVVAATYGVDEVAAQACQSSVLLNEIEFDRCDCKSALDPRFAFVVVRFFAGRIDDIPATTAIVTKLSILRCTTSSCCDKRLAFLPNGEVYDCRHNKCNYVLPNLFPELNCLGPKISGGSELVARQSIWHRQVRLPDKRGAFTKARRGVLRLPHAFTSKPA
jgi:hypothetical protein